MIAIVDYQAGNLTSVRSALKEIGREAVITSDPAQVAAAERIIFPGVGAAGASMGAIKRNGLGPALRKAVAAGKPFLGICVGCQIIFDWSLEDGRTACLGLLPGGTGVFKRTPSNPIKVPHMGWNQVRLLRHHPVFEGIPDKAEFYFVHSYYPMPASRDLALAETRHGDATFASAVGQGSLVAVQFHAEKSGPHGLKLLDNFCRWDGAWSGDAGKGR